MFRANIQMFREDVQNNRRKNMGRKKYFAALAAAGMIGAMAVGSAFNSYAADGWTKSNDHWTYIFQGKTYTGWLETSEGKYYMDLYDGHMTT